ncbi:MAG: dihydrofolate reductase family protein [Propionibacteriales bacterium]|nr:dihydrofolate reductase family protein [Propionibacteriales bacterium]
MGTIVISENVTLDGVIEDPTGEDGFDRGGWFGQIGDDDRQAWAEVEAGEADRAEALLLGRCTYEWLAARWMSRTGAWAERLTSMPKYVVSSTLEEPAWANTSVLNGPLLDEVSALKGSLTGEIVVNGSGHLAHTLIEHGLVDELRLMVYPFVLGAGKRLFPSTRAQQAMRLVDARTIGNCLALLRYDVVRSE